MQDCHALFTGEDDTWEDCLLGDFERTKTNNYEAVCSCHIIFTQMNLHFKCISLAYYTLFVIWFLVSYDGRSPLAILSHGLPWTTVLIMPNPLPPCTVTEHSLYSVQVTADGVGPGLPPCASSIVACRAASVYDVLPHC